MATKGNQPITTVLKLLTITKLEIIQMAHLHFDKAIFKKLTEDYDNSEQKPSKYWQDYTNLILSEIRKDELRGFGKSYNLTRGFGDAMHFPKRARVRKLIKFPFLYEPVEKFLALRRQKKQQQGVFESSKNFFSKKSYIDKLSKELNGVTEALGINRYNLIERNKVPWRYLQFFAYIELIHQLIKTNKLTIDIGDLLNGNTMDIGGGYGPVTDGFFCYKRMNNIGANSTDYILEQFPVAFIANQYLSYRHKNNIMFPLSSDNNLITKEEQTGRKIRVIQNTASDYVKNLNIGLFFNSNSFQEMDQSQIKYYSKFMKKNKSGSSYLLCFFYSNYDVSSGRNSPEPSLEIFETEFSLLGKSVLTLDGFVSGTLYLFKI